MALVPAMIGHTLGHYRIKSKLGEGGMGVVYKARDTHLDRVVAIKVLPPEKRTDPERQRRFVQEARAASALNHPNILHVYDIDHAGDLTFMVMEYVEGTTLGSRIGPGGLKPRETLAHAVQVADALAAAHAAGIVHRDIKPSNIMVGDNGVVKVVDFGLAKLTEAAGSEEAADTRTASPQTAEGLVVGTVAYMSPKQAEGRRVDGRSDVFSFGSVLYEMASGQRPFTGSSNVEVLHAVSQARFRPLSEVRPDTPPELRAIIEKALEREPDDRYQSTRDLVVDLKRAQRSLALGRSGASAVLPAAQAPRRRPIALAAVAILLLVATGGALWRFWPSAPDWTNPLEAAQFRRLTDFDGSEYDAVLSADGKLVAFLANREGNVDLLVSQVGTAQFSRLTVGEGDLLSLPTTVQTLAFSPEGSHVGLSVGSTTALVPVMGGAPRPLLDPGIEAVWSPDGRRLAYHELTAGDPILIADADGSNRRPLFQSAPGQHNHHLSWSLDGEHLYFARGLITAGELDVWRIAAAGGEPEQLTFHGARTSHPLALDDNTLLYVSTAEDAARTVLYAMDLRTRVTRPINLGVRQYLSLGASADRRRIVVTESNPGGSVWTIPVSESVSDERTAARYELPSARAIAPRAGPDYVLYLSSTGGTDGLWKFQDGAAAELWRGDRGGVAAAPGISADGRQIAFCVRQQGKTRLYRMAASGANPVLMAPSLHVRSAPSWSPDGQWIVVSGDDEGGPALFLVPAGSGVPERLLPGLYFNPVWSPDGRFIVYSEDVESGGTLRVRAIAPDRTPFPLPELRVSYIWDAYRFLPNGRTLLVLQGGIAGIPQNFWTVDLTTEARAQISDLHRTAVIQGFDVTPDGRTILFDRIRENADIVLIERPAR